ncbi:MAG: glycosyltransferase family 9 protein [Brumimicrobium sp.]|nr:glycosyltransferase family 9 protein [Brumimicrobium sp.]
MTKILVIRFSSIGDIVLTSPVLRGIKTQLNSVELHVLTKYQYAILFNSNPHVDKIHTWGKENKEVIENLKNENFDYVIDLHKNIRTAKIKNHLKSKSYSFPKLNVEKWTYVNFKWNLLPDVHIVDRYFEAVKNLGVKNDQQGLDYFIPENDQINLIENFQTDKIIAVALGAQFATKRLPSEKLSSILSGSILPVVLLGGAEDQEIGEEIINRAENTTFFNMCGKLNLNQSASVVRQAKVLLTHDTGLMHIASAFDTPIVSVWGNTVPEFGMYPYKPGNKGNYSIHEVKGLSCRPCSKIGFQKCPKKHFKCMVDQDVEAIKKAINNYVP